MKTTFILIFSILLWTITPALAEASDRDRSDRGYEKNRDHHVSQQVKRHDRGRDHDGRHNKYWKKQSRHQPRDHSWKRNRYYRPVVYRPMPRGVVYREVPTRVIYPASALRVSVPDLSFYFAW